MKLSKYIACICEGAAEQAIIECLLDANKLIFTYDDMIEGEVIRCRSDEKITVLRILDSRREKFKLSKAYAPKIDVINVITAPEIEMLIILNEGKYAEYKKSNKKPSEFCKTELKYKNVKSTEFLKEYFADASVLVSAIIEYKRVSNIRNGECTLADLLR